jgi:DNA-binding LacI/PurR family transcriptional regulator
MIVPELASPNFPQLIRGADALARDEGYSLIVVNSDDDGDRQRDVLSMLRSQRVEGVLLVIAASPTPVSQIAKMIKAGVHVVCLDRVPNRVPVDTVSVEDTEAARLAVEHLLQEGFRRIAIVTGLQTIKNERRRLRGYQLALEGAGLLMEEDLVWSGNQRPKDVAQMCRTRLGSNGLQPDSIFCTNGPTGLGVLHALRDCGLWTPDDLGFVTIDELTSDDSFCPSITSVVQPLYDIGWWAAQLLLDRIENRLPVGGLKSVRLQPSLRIGDSSRRSQPSCRVPIRTKWLYRQPVHRGTFEMGVGITNPASKVGWRRRGQLKCARC